MKETSRCVLLLLFWTSHDDDVVKNQPSQRRFEHYWHGDKGDTFRLFEQEGFHSVKVHTFFTCSPLHSWPITASVCLVAFQSGYQDIYIHQQGRLWGPRILGASPGPLWGGSSHRNLFKSLQNINTSVLPLPLTSSASCKTCIVKSVYWNIKFHLTHAQNFSKFILLTFFIFCCRLICSSETRAEFVLTSFLVRTRSNKLFLCISGCAKHYCFIRDAAQPCWHTRYFTLQNMRSSL